MSGIEITEEKLQELEKLRKKVIDTKWFDKKKLKEYKKLAKDSDITNRFMAVKKLFELVNQDINDFRSIHEKLVANLPLKNQILYNFFTNRDLIDYKQIQFNNDYSTISEKSRELANNIEKTIIKKVRPIIKNVISKNLDVQLTEYLKKFIFIYSYSTSTQKHVESDLSSVFAGLNEDFMEDIDVKYYLICFSFKGGADPTFDLSNELAEFINKQIISKNFEMRKSVLSFLLSKIRDIINNYSNHLPEDQSLVKKGRKFREVLYTFIPNFLKSFEKEEDEKLILILFLIGMSIFDANAPQLDTFIQLLNQKRHLYNDFYKQEIDEFIKGIEEKTK